MTLRPKLRLAAALVMAAVTMQGSITETSAQGMYGGGHHGGGGGGGGWHGPAGPSGGYRGGGAPSRGYSGPQGMPSSKSYSQSPRYAPSPKYAPPPKYSSSPRYAPPPKAWGGPPGGPPPRGFRHAPPPGPVYGWRGPGHHHYPALRGERRFWVGGRNYSVWYDGYRVRRDGGWRTLAALSALGTVAVAGTLLYPYAYIDTPATYCTGLTEDGCELRWQEVPTLEGPPVVQCVAFCPW